VEANLVELANRQATNYNKLSSTQHFAVGDCVWLSIPTARKLDPRWDGKWTITAVKGLLVMKISNGTTSKVVHVNRLHHILQPSPSNTTVLNIDKPSIWNPPQVEHFIDKSPPEVHVDHNDSEPTIRRYPVRIRHPPSRYIEESRDKFLLGGAYVILVLCIHN